MIAAHQRDQVAEDGGLDEAGGHVHDLQVLEGVADIGVRVEAELEDADQVAAADADDIGDQDEEGQHQQAGEQARHDQVLVRVGRERGERVDLLGDPHGADFRRHRGADPSGDHEAGQHGPQFAGDRKHHDGRDRAFGREAGEAGVALQRQDHAGEEAGQPHHRQGIEADLHHLAQKQARVEGRPYAVRGCFERKEREAPDGLEQREHAVADRL